jgi:D-psicose/D-tagatose/L-ribulose 3-epimerase
MRSLSVALLCALTPSLYAQGPTTTPGPGPGPAATTVPAVLPSPVPGYPIGWCLRVQGTTLEDAKKAGFEYVELALQDVLSLDEAGYDVLKSRLAGLGIPARVGYNLVPNDLSITGPAADLEKQNAHLKRALARVGGLGLKYVVLGSGKARHVPDGFPREKAYDQLVDFSRRLADEAKAHGVDVLVQPLRATDTNLVNTVPEAAELVDKVARPNFQMIVDYSFLIIGKEDPAAVRQAGTRVKHVWMANPNGRGYPMRAEEAEYAAFFQALQAAGYRGGLSVHARTDDFPGDAARAITLLRTLARGLGALPRK